MKKKILLTAVAAAAIAVSAQAQECFTAGQPYTFTGTAASGTGTITYQWYRNNEPIANATSASYTMPGNLAFGSNVEIKRGVVSSTCPYNTQYTGSFIIMFHAPLRVNNTTWATFNVDNSPTLASCTDLNGKLYQWDRTTAWTAGMGSANGWNSNANTSTTWANNLCPSGWRLPTKTEFDALVSSGWSYADKDTRGNKSAGVFMGPNSANCTFNYDMTSCIFLPAASYRNNSGQGVPVTVGYYWSSTQVDSSNGYHLLINASGSPVTVSVSSSSKAIAASIRCVQ